MLSEACQHYIGIHRVHVPIVTCNRARPLSTIGRVSCCSPQVRFTSLILGAASACPVPYPARRWASARWLSRWVRVDLVAVAAAVFLPRLAAMSRSRASVGDAQQNPGVVGRKTPAPPYFVGHSFLEKYC